jgi:RNA polymerase sigma factor (sigma-70 family)
MATAAPEVPPLARDLAFERLYRRYVKDVYHYSLALLRNPADAEDVTQTTFMNAYRAFKRGEQPEKPQNWLIKIAHNAARTRYARSMRRVKEVPLDDHLDSLPVSEDEKPDVAEVLDALGRLPLNQRAALVMRELEGRSYAEIADTLGVSVPAVETLIFRARRSLKLKASAVKVLSVIPVPPSLVQLFGGGTVVAGGGAAVGSSFLLKAAVAVVAGAVATGVSGGDRAQQAEAARPATALAAPNWRAVGAFSRALVLPRAAGSARVAVATPHGGTTRFVRSVRHWEARTGGRTEAPARTSVVSTIAQVATPSPAAALPQPAPSSQPQTTTVEQVSSTVESVKQTLPSVPVTPPALPSPPAVPALPALPQVPSPPPLPPAPTLPPLPKLP